MVRSYLLQMWFWIGMEVITFVPILFYPVVSRLPPVCGLLELIPSISWLVTSLSFYLMFVNIFFDFFVKYPSVVNLTKKFKWYIELYQVQCPLDVSYIKLYFYKSQVLILIFIKFLCENVFLLYNAKKLFM